MKMYTSYTLLRAGDTGTWVIVLACSIFVNLQELRGSLKLAYGLR